jgi:hypothetical protein
MFVWCSFGRMRSGIIDLNFSMVWLNLCQWRFGLIIKVGQCYIDKFVMLRETATNEKQPSARTPISSNSLALNDNIPLFENELESIGCNLHICELEIWVAKNFVAKTKAWAYTNQLVRRQS